jgi:phospholipase/carboxylesterase
MGSPSFVALKPGLSMIENLVTNALSLASFIEAACANYCFSRLPIAVGFSNGAIMSAALLLKRPGLFAGAILFRPLSPFAPYAMRPLNGVPVLMIDGKHDPRRLPGDGHRLATCLRDARRMCRTSRAANWP